MPSGRSWSTRATARRRLVAAALAALAAVGLAACGGGEAEPSVTAAAPSAPPAPPALPAGITVRAPNEAGLVPVLMYHKVVPEITDGNAYSRTIAEFQADLERLWREGYVPIPLADLVAGRIRVPKGRSPVVLTFDDSSPDHFRYLPDGSVDPSSAVGIMNAFAERHPDFGRHAVFFLTSKLFDQPGTEQRKLEQLIAWGYEIGNHTYSHANLADLPPKGARKEIARMKALIGELLPGYRVRLFCLPYGAFPADPELIARGTWNGISYRHDANVLVGAEPSPSPFATRFDAFVIPRIRAAGGEGVENQIDYWLDLLAHDGTAFISDGDPRTVTVDAALADLVAVRPGQELAPTTTPAATDADGALPATTP